MKMYFLCRDTLKGRKKKIPVEVIRKDNDETLKCLVAKTGLGWRKGEIIFTSLKDLENRFD